MTLVIIIEMMQISKSAFKSRMLEIMRDIERTGEEVVVTDHGKPTIVVRPYESKLGVDEAFGDLHGTLLLHEDPDTPTTEEWEHV